MDLASLGWNQFFAKHFEPYASEHYRAGRIALEQKSSYRVYTEEGELWAEISGRMRHQAISRVDLPAVGDWVVLSIRIDEQRATIHQVLPRKSKFSRKVKEKRTVEQIVAANIDTLFLVVGLDNDFNLRRIERYLILAWESGARPIILLNKADLCRELDARMAAVESVAAGVPICLLSAANNEGLEALGEFIKAGETISLVGSSGVGKSTIINCLLGKQYQRVQEVREHDHRGKHTTSYRELILLPSGGLIIDTPGMRELQLWTSEKGFQDAFDEIETLNRSCRFRNCQHQDEPGCAIKESLEDGSLDIERFNNYQKLQRELHYLQIRQDQRSALAEKAKWKKIHQAQKRYKNRW
ncbi:MAG: ribosome small subunit-dependent GTPase A [Acidobacteriota bacterium]